MWVSIVIVALLLIVVLVVRHIHNSAVEVEIVTATLTYPSQANAVLMASGYVVAQKKASVASKGTGRLVYLGVEEGDKVREGQIIARLDDTNLQVTLRLATAQLEAFSVSFLPRTFGSAPNRLFHMS